MTSIKTGPTTPGLHWLAIPVATSIILFLGYSSQWLFHTASYLEPGPLTTAESITFNTLLLCLLWTYFRACTVDPGRYVFDIPTVFDPKTDPASRALFSSSASSSSSSSSSYTPTASPTRWCKKCRAPKPPRAHHCRHCARCVPKMDHHCPWTGNCVSMQTFPYFLRFVVFTNVSLWMLGYLLAQRFYALWAERHLPAYLGPTLLELAHLTILALVCSATMLTLSIMLYTTVYAWLFNTTMIESWEIDRHEAVVDRYNSTHADGTFWDEGDDYDDGGDDYNSTNAGSDDDDDDDDGDTYDESPRKKTAPRSRVEFPYDIGFFGNMSQAMGTVNIFLWFFPFASGPKVAIGGSGAGWDWPENGFNSEPGMWPPPDPDKIRRAKRESWAEQTDQTMAATSGHDYRLSPNSSWKTGTPEEELAAFKQRQAADFRRRQHGVVAKAVVEEEGMDGRPGWTNADGDRLRDYGVDEEVDGDEDDVPLSELLQRRKKGQ
ncbi:dhhc zinc finger membrane protein [Grosmannia clavigera kw1407]|uniref:Palmitoyltransferase PFA4 n=1 Tax=Grosmannia clavigera (strain kw1407 / UAMH 11150) TaxID=655863 RepID=F0XCI0_GROCL|nr:dhhc zinc finger membrane protein [Grosmannia clavigera kw1407]EFX04409.1 dhhc zinc finger membrane protein [Grosmannia clavigera kw1407]